MSRIKRNKDEVASDILTETKVCSVCEDRKDFNEFYNYKNKSDGKSYRCKLCDDLARNKWRYNNPERSRESSRIRQWKYKYGIEQKDYDKMLVDQDG